MRERITALSLARARRPRSPRRRVDTEEDPSRPRLQKREVYVVLRKIIEGD